MLYRHLLLEKLSGADDMAGSRLGDVSCEPGFEVGVEISKNLGHTPFSSLYVQGFPIIVPVGRRF